MPSTSTRHHGLEATTSVPFTCGFAVAGDALEAVGDSEVGGDSEVDGDSEAAAGVATAGDCGTFGVGPAAGACGSSAVVVGALV
jgi:hypothetical protein